MSEPTHLRTSSPPNLQGDALCSQPKSTEADMKGRLQHPLAGTTQHRGVNLLTSSRSVTPGWFGHKGIKSSDKVTEEMRVLTAALSEGGKRGTKSL
ncbi:hypothetical protein AGIG_G4995 [Arapaima gigas]